MSYGYRGNSYGYGPSGAPLTLGALSLSASSIAENSATGTLVGLIQGATPGSTLSIQSQERTNWFQLSGSQLQVGSGGIDYETDTSATVTIRETLAGASNSPRDTVFAITITDVAEEEAETTALVARMTVAPDSTRRGHINTLIASLKSAGVWAKLQVLQVYAAHHAQASLLNWKSASFNAANTGLTHTTDRGYTGNAANYINSGFNPSSAGLSNSSFSLGIYNRVSGARDQWDFGASAGGVSILHGLQDSINNYYAGMCGDAMIGAVGGVTPLGLRTINRTGNSASLRRNGTQYAFNGALASPATIPNLNLFVLTQNSSGSPALICNSTRQAALFFVASYLDATEETALYNAAQTYMTALGANV